jgi:hypothetical protein
MLLRSHDASLTEGHQARRQAKHAVKLQAQPSRRISASGRKMHRTKRHTGLLYRLGRSPHTDVPFTVPVSLLTLWLSNEPCFWDDQTGFPELAMPVIFNND